MNPTQYVKKAALFLASHGVNQPTENDWKNAVRQIARENKKTLTHREFSESLMIAHEMFKKGISKAFVQANKPKQLAQ